MLSTPRIAFCVYNEFHDGGRGQQLIVYVNMLVFVPTKVRKYSPPPQYFINLIRLKNITSLPGKRLCKFDRLHSSFCSL